MSLELIVNVVFFLQIFIKERSRALEEMSIKLSLKNS